MKTKRIKLFIFSLLAGSSVFAQDLSTTATTSTTEAVAAKPYIGADFSLYHTLGSGTMSRTFAENQSFTTDLMIRPTVKSKTFWGDRYIKAHLEFNSSFEWLPSEGTATADRFSFSDLRLRAQLKNAVDAKNIGIKFTPGLKLEIPSSQASSKANRVLGLGTNMSLSWSKWGLTLSYKPTAIGYFYSLPYQSSACEPDSSPESALGNGQCRLDGRQTLFVMKNGLYAEYAVGDHNFLVGFKTFHGILRPTGDAQKYTEASLGVVEYSYALPTKVPVYLSLGATSFNPSQDPVNGFRVPFMSRVDGASNFTSIYAGLDIAI